MRKLDNTYFDTPGAGLRLLASHFDTGSAALKLAGS
jgi:hypothetical protein